MFNTLQALLAQQTRQIGVMKALGATNGQILGLYFVMVLIYGLLALLIAVPLGALGAYGLTRYAAGMVNFDIASFGVPLQVFALEVVVGLLVPLLAALYPILGGVHITAHEAMSDYGVNGGNYGQGRVDRLVERVQSLPRPLLLSLRNTFRRKGRLALTLSTLTVSGAIFIAVFSTQASMMRSIDETYDYIKYDIVVSMERGYRVDQLEREALAVPGVAIAEAWRFDNAWRVRLDGTESQPLAIRAPRADTPLVNPTVTEGRWLLPEDENAIVVNTYLLKDEPDIDVGDEITLKLGREETAWLVVGIVGKTPPMPMVFVNQPYYAELTGGSGPGWRGHRRHATTRPGLSSSDSRGHRETVRECRAARGIHPDEHHRASADRLAAERARRLPDDHGDSAGPGWRRRLDGHDEPERAGANARGRRDAGHRRGRLRYLADHRRGGRADRTAELAGSALLAYPLGKIMSDAVGISVIQMKLTYEFSVVGAGIWLAAVVVLSALASFWPARNASRVTVREVLAYE